MLIHIYSLSFRVINSHFSTMSGMIKRFLAF